MFYLKKICHDSVKKILIFFKLRNEKREKISVPARFLIIITNELLEKKSYTVFVI